MAPSPQGRKESNVTEYLRMHACMHAFLIQDMIPDSVTRCGIQTFRAKEASGGSGHFIEYFTMGHSWLCRYARF